MLVKIDLLERCLAAWEDYWFLLEILARTQRGKSALASTQRSAVEHYREFRSFLLKRCVPPEPLQAPTLPDQFLPPPDIAAEVPPTIANIPRLVFSWCAYSRRIYAMSEELQAVLGATAMYRTCWEDISLPFPAFAIRLEKPFRDPDREEFSMVFLYTVQTPEGEVWQVQCLSNRCLEYQPLSPALRQHWLEKSQKGKAEAVQRFADQQIKRLACIGGYSFGLRPTNRRELVPRTANRLAEQFNLSAGAKEAFEQMVRTVVGLALYLRALPPGSMHISSWSGVHLPNSADHRAITKGSQVCSVSSIYQLTPEERRLMGLGGDGLEHPELALSSHFRSGHWRRRRGSGHDPAAPRVEHVRWTIVRRDRLTETGGLPHGTMQMLGS